jgi:hypothetical protein
MHTKHYDNILKTGFLINQVESLGYRFNRFDYRVNPIFY